MSVSSLTAHIALLMAAIGLAACDSGGGEGAQPKGAAGVDAGVKVETVAAGTVVRDHAGSPMPDFAFEDPSGDALALSSLRGTPVLLNLWATWCAPCITEMPLLDKVAQEREGLRVLTVSQDMETERVAPFFAEQGFAKLEPWLDAENQLAFHYEGGQLPLTVLYDAEGKEVWRVIGDLDWTGEKARALLDEV